MTNAEQITELREQGYRVRIFHYRRLEVDPKLLAGVDNRWRGVMVPLRPAMNGGETEVQIFGSNDTFLVRGVAYCSDEDNYVKKFGVMIALARAKKELAKHEEELKQKILTKTSTPELVEVTPDSVLVTA